MFPHTLIPQKERALHPMDESQGLSGAELGKPLYNIHM
jgi:hypothetical protein